MLEPLLTVFRSQGTAIATLIFLAFVFIPFERLFAETPGQPVFRPGWRADALHFVIDAAFLRLLLPIVYALALGWLRFVMNSDFQAAVAAQPWWLQIIVGLVIADLGFYVAHRLNHRVPLLWRFHSVHHSVKQMDWLAFARLHPLEELWGRTLQAAPLYLMGFSNETFGAILLIGPIHAALIHANLGWGLGPLRWIIVTPEYHHWHHGDDPKLYNKNFAGFFPVIDWIFGSYYSPRHQQPETYGITDPIPLDYIGQMIYPFVSRETALQLVRSDKARVGSG